MGAAAGAGTLLAPTILTSRKSTVYAQGTVTEPVLCAATPVPQVRRTRRLSMTFRSHLWRHRNILTPTPTETANTLNGEAARDPHQRWAEFNAGRYLPIEARAGTHQFHQRLPAVVHLGFQWAIPGSDDPQCLWCAVARAIQERLPTTTTSFGTNKTTVHLHNGHTASESDGFAGDFFNTGLFKDNHYANAYAGIDEFPGNFPKGDSREAQYTYWYHDHLQAETANNNYLGMNGMYIAYDQKSPPWEFNTPGSIRLPAYFGVTDFPLILAQKRFCATNPTAGRTEQFQVDGGSGSVDGQIHGEWQDSAKTGCSTAQIPLPLYQFRRGIAFRLESPRSGRLAKADDGRRGGRQFTGNAG